MKSVIIWLAGIALILLAFWSGFFWWNFFFPKWTNTEFAWWVVPTGLTIIVVNGIIGIVGLVFIIACDEISGNKRGES